MFSSIIGLMLVSIMQLWTLPALGLTVGNPMVVISNQEINPTNRTNYQPDASLSTFRRHGENFWLLPMWDKAHGGIVHVKALGSLARPLAKIEWIKKRNQLFKVGNVQLNGSYWIVNTYETARGILAFIHVEDADGSGVGGGPGKSRIALAWSADGGESFTFLGNIIIPFGDPESFNIEGAPYIIKENFFYLYFKDIKGISVARAPVSDVIEAAQRGTVSKWMKYAGPAKGFSSAGLGGVSQSIGVDGISHSDAACSTYNKKCYLVLTRMNWKDQDTWINLYESVNGVKWSFVQSVIREQHNKVKKGFQYATIVNADGSDNGVVGKRFFIYCDKDHQEESRRTYRWAIDLGN